MPLRVTGSLRLCRERMRAIQHKIPWLIVFFVIQLFLFKPQASSFGFMWRHDTCKSDIDQGLSRVDSYCQQNINSLTKPHQYRVLSAAASLLLIQVAVIVLRRVIASFWEARTWEVEVIVTHNAIWEHWLLPVACSCTTFNHTSLKDHAYCTPPRPCSYIFYPCNF